MNFKRFRKHFRYMGPHMCNYLHDIMVPCSFCSRISLEFMFVKADMSEIQQYLSIIYLHELPCIIDAIQMVLV